MAVRESFRFKVVKRPICNVPQWHHLSGEDFICYTDPDNGDLLFRYKGRTDACIINYSWSVSVDACEIVEDGSSQIIVNRWRWNLKQTQSQSSYMETSYLNVVKIKAPFLRTKMETWWISQWDSKLPTTEPVKPDQFTRIILLLLMKVWDIR